jgi:hypothetical protein
MNPGLFAKIAVWIFFFLGAGAVVTAVFLYISELTLSVEHRNWQVTDKRLQRLCMLGTLCLLTSVVLKYLSG